MSEGDRAKKTNHNKKRNEALAERKGEIGREQSNGARSSMRWGEYNRMREECCRKRRAKKYKRAILIQG